MELIVGTVLGFLSGMGVGGGSLLLLWLTAAKGVEFETARSINLLFFFPAAIVASGFRLRQISVKRLIPAAIAGCIAAAAFSVLSQSWDTSLLRKGFGVLLILTAFREWKAK